MISVVCIRLDYYDNNLNKELKRSFNLCVSEIPKSVFGKGLINPK